jgi:hypothetical protein
MRVNFVILIVQTSEVVIPFFGAIPVPTIHKIENYFTFEMRKKKFQRIIELLTQKIVTKLSNIWVWDPGSWIRNKPIPDPGVKKAPERGFATPAGSRVLNFSIFVGNFCPPGSGSRLSPSTRKKNL